MTEPATAPLVTEGRIESAPVAALAALFDDGLPVPGPGDPLPPLWHWVALARWHPFTANGGDGHARTGGFLPDLGKPRRMFAGGRVSFLAPLQVGETVWQEDEVLAVTPKRGSQGDFFLVEVRSRIFGSAGVLAIDEVRNIIYRDAAAPAAAAPAGHTYETVPQLLARSARGWTLTTDPTALMRFSSATSNGHRIHYDFPYATRVEGYPGLVVHGPLMTLSLAEVLRHEYPEHPPTTLAHRNLRPLFCAERAEIEVANGGAGEVELTLTREGAPRVTLAAQL